MSGRALLACVFALVVSGCGGGGVSTAPNTTPLIQSTSGSAQFALSATASSSQLTVSEFAYTGSYTAASSNTAVATVAPAALQGAASTRLAQAKVQSASDGSATFTITAVQNGNANIVVADDIGHTASFPVVVTGLATPAPAASPSAVPTTTPSPIPSHVPTASPSPNVPTPSPSPTASPTPAPTASPTPTPIPTASPGPLSASPLTLTFNGTAQVQSVQLTDPGTTSFTISGCSGVATLGAIASGAFTVTSVAAGSCSIVASDTFNHHVTIAVGVTTLGVPIQ